MICPACGNGTRGSAGQGFEPVSWPEKGKYFRCRVCESVVRSSLMAGTVLIEKQNIESPVDLGYIESRVSTESISNQLLLGQAVRDRYSGIPWTPDELGAEELEQLSGDDFRVRAEGLTTVGLQNLHCLIRYLEDPTFASGRQDLIDQFVLTKEEMNRRCALHLGQVECAGCGHSASVHHTESFGVLGTTIGDGEALWCFRCDRVSQLKFGSEEIVAQLATDVPVPGAVRCEGNASLGTGLMDTPALRSALRASVSLARGNRPTSSPVEALWEDCLHSAGYALGNFAQWVAVAPEPLSQPTRLCFKALTNAETSAQILISMVAESILDAHVERAWPERFDLIRKQLSAISQDWPPDLRIGEASESMPGPFDSPWTFRASEDIFVALSLNTPPSEELDLLAGQILGGYKVMLRGPIYEREA